LKPKELLIKKIYLRLKLRAARIGDSIENTSTHLNQSPSGNDIRYHLDKINNFEQLESQICAGIYYYFIVLIKEF
jgi:hypothetical protein